MPFSATAADDALFPLPEELQRDVAFWRDIFTEYDVDEGVLHDNRNLAVIYERVKIPENLTRRAQQRLVADRRKRVRAALLALADGKRNALSEFEQNVLAAWAPDVDNATLKKAAGQIRFQHGLKTRFREGLARSGRWRAHVNSEFEELGVPLALAALPHVESSYNPDARSHVGASGIWQFTRSTGRRFMRVDHVIDDRNDPFKATRAAGRLLAYNYSITGNWPMAITAYNHGLGGVRRAMRQFGDTAYVDILRKYKGRTFGFASRNFYVAFVAAMQVDQNPGDFFDNVVAESPTQYETAELTGFVPADDLVKALGVSASALKRHNRGLQSTIWQGSKHLPKGYVLRFPTSQASLIAALEALPPSRIFDEQLPDLFHTVRRGDTLSGIASTYKTRVSTLTALNNLRSQHRIRAGQKLRLPAAGPAPQQDVDEPLATPAVTVAEVAAESPAEALVVDEDTAVAEASVAILASSETELLSDPSDYSVSEDGTIEVHPLETLGHFGDWLDIKTQRLRDLNSLAFRAPVSVGQRIRLDFSVVQAKQFEDRRIEFHRQAQDAFFRTTRISGVQPHRIRAGEAIWILALREYRVPLWLFRQYNPSVDLHRVRPGTLVQIPLLEKAAAIP